MNKRFIVFLSSRKSWTLPYIIFSAIFVIIPLFLIVVYAFTDDSGHLTLANFQKFFEHPEAINTFVYSIGIAIITTLVCILLGYPAAWILSNSNPLRISFAILQFGQVFVVNRYFTLSTGLISTSSLRTVTRLVLTFFIQECSTS